MTKTVIIPDDMHLLIVKKQMYIRENYGVNPRITDILVAYIKAGLDRTEELLNIKVYYPKICESNEVVTNGNEKSKIILVEEAEVRT